ncbi:SGNH/GDSL hydrolase family protein [Actinomadura flavalba]|uniref:SGNH/GDSL hydrolase family protein n=1 Tax=Actinomadura flavalba TaxID=1120938 RepID=UPI00036E9245|nr:SGNH/GDSL hydrolase family protein [Actinomadura flavalba]
MTRPGERLRRARARLDVAQARLGARVGQRRLAAITLVALLAVATVPLVAFPAVRCELFDVGCRSPLAAAPADPERVGDGTRTPVEAATAGAYAALGDSYSSGVGAEGGLADRNPLERCRRTSKAYFHAVAAAFPFAESGHFACSGATTRHVLNGKSGEPSQVGRLGPGTSLVTLSVGGNDVGFSKIIANCVVKLPWSGKCTGQGPEIAGRMAELRVALPTVLDRITAAAPNARVLVMGYPRAFSELAGTAGDNLTVVEQRWLNARAHDLNELIRLAAAEADERLDAAGRPGSVEFADAYSAFAGHEAGSADPYMNGLSVDLGALEAEPRSFHPTARGHEALARLFTDQIRSGPNRPLHAPRA